MDAITPMTSPDFRVDPVARACDVWAPAAPARWLIGRTVREPNRRVADWHGHARGQILGVRAGVMSVQTARLQVLVGPGQAVWLPAGLVHRARSHGAFSGWSLYVAPGSVADAGLDGPFVVAASALFAAQAERLAEETFAGGWDGRIARLAHTCWDEFAGLPRASVAVPLPEDTRLRRVADAMCAEPGDRRSVEAWAGVAGMSERSFVRLFASAVGMPFSAWRTRVRMLAAQERLARQEAVGAVAFAVGYDGPSAFAVAFRRATGVMPRDYARACRDRGD